MELSLAARIWNRACFASADQLASLREADRLLASVVCVDGYVMNGGVLHMLGIVDAEGLQAAARGLACLGFHEASAWFSTTLLSVDVERASDALEASLNQAYWQLLDNKLLPAFQQHFASNPDAYAPYKDSDDDPEMKAIAAALAAEFGPKH